MSSDQFLGEIRAFPFNFPPTGWALCDGQLLPLAQNTALFSLLGTYYGGDGRSTFALPDLRGSVAIASARGPGLSERWLGESGGVDSVTLLTSEMPPHSHQLAASGEPATSRSPRASDVLAASVEGNLYAPSSSGSVAHDAGMLAPAGSSQPHTNLMPYLTMHYCIALQGIFPQRP